MNTKERRGATIKLAWQYLQPCCAHSPASLRARVYVADLGHPASKQAVSVDRPVLSVALSCQLIGVCNEPGRVPYNWPCVAHRWRAWQLEEEVAAGSALSSVAGIRTSQGVQPSAAPNKHGCHDVLIGTPHAVLPYKRLSAVTVCYRVFAKTMAASSWYTYTMDAVHSRYAPDVYCDERGSHKHCHRKKRADLKGVICRLVDGLPHMGLVGDHRQTRTIE